jgi:divalent metal cation (Fe/Co/Zn/Cd) transporter
MPLPLVERSETEIAQTIKRRIEAIKEIKGYHQLSVHVTGKRAYVEMHVLLDSNLTFEETHRIASHVESEVKNVLRNARVTVHTEPVGKGHENLWEQVKEIAEGMPGSRGVHNIHIQEIDGKLGVDLHLEVSGDMNLKQAHRISEDLEKKIKEANPGVADITVHIESAAEMVQRERAGVETELESHIKHIAESFPEVKGIPGMQIRRVGENLHVVLRCTFDSNIDVNKAHVITMKMEQKMKKAYPKISRIDIHEEPEES